MEYKVGDTVLVEAEILFIGTKEKENQVKIISPRICLTLTGGWFDIADIHSKIPRPLKVGDNVRPGHGRTAGTIIFMNKNVALLEYNGNMCIQYEFFNPKILILVEDNNIA